MSTVTSFHDVLQKTTRCDQAAGLPIFTLTEILRYHLATTQSDSKVNVATIQPMIEMYMVSQNFGYRITYSGGKAMIRGLTWKLEKARLLADILTTGIVGSVDQATKAKEAYDSIWPAQQA